MRESSSGSCTHLKTTRLLIHDAIHGHERQAAQYHLELCEVCRRDFRAASENRLPHVPNYTFLELIGRGGFGQVYKAIHHTTTRTDAVKVLSRVSQKRIDSFANEVQLVAHLRHPNIVTLYEAYLDSHPPYYSMELIEGHHLGAYLERHQLTLSQRLRIIATVAEAIDYAHQQGVIHRDIKPQNVLMNLAGEPRVVDFGVAKWAESEAMDDTQSNQSEGVVGTRGYIAPEVYRGESVDLRSDIYSLGALLHAIILSECPQRDHSHEGVQKRLSQAEIERPADLAAIMTTCLADQPDDRYDSAGELSRDLNRYIQGQAVLARHDSSWGYQASRVASLIVAQSPGLVIGLIVILATAFLAAIYEGGQLRQSVAGMNGPEAAMIGFTPSTLVALKTGNLGPDLEQVSAHHRKSWRRLYGRVMERLAEVNPRVVVWDYYFPDCHEEHDPSLIDGILALDAPVVFAIRDVAPDGTPEMCPALEMAVTSYGSAMMTWRKPNEWGEMDVAVGMQRGFNDWVPSLAVAAFAAARHPEASPSLHEQENALQIRYLRQNVADGSYPWLNDYDMLPLSGMVAVEPQHIEAAAGTQTEGALQTADRYRVTRIDAARSRIDPNAIIPMEKVLSASSEQLRKWFDQRAVIVGQVLPGFDQYRFGNGTKVYGVEVHAAATQALLRRASVVKVNSAEIRFSLATGSFLAALLAIFVPLTNRWRIRFWSTLAVCSVGLGFGGAVLATQQALPATWMLAAFLVPTLLVVLVPVLLVRAVQQRRLHGSFTAPQPTEGGLSETLVLHTHQQTSSSASTGQSQ